MQVNRLRVSFQIFYLSLERINKKSGNCSNQALDASGLTLKQIRIKAANGEQTTKQIVTI